MNVFQHGNIFQTIRKEIGTLHIHCVLFKCNRVQHVKSAVPSESYLIMEGESAIVPHHQVTAFIPGFKVDVKGLARVFVLCIML